MTGNMHSKVYTKRSTWLWVALAICPAGWKQYVTALAVPISANAATLTSVLLVKWMKIFDRRLASLRLLFAEPSFRKRKKALTHSTMAMQTK